MILYKALMILYKAKLAMAAKEKADKADKVDNTN